LTKQGIKKNYTRQAIQLAWSAPCHDVSQGNFVYMISKTVAEQAVLDFYKEKKPRFAANSFAL
jgi:hypothetical protein